MALVDTLTVEPNNVGIEPGDYSVHNLDCIGTQFLISATGYLTVVCEGHPMWGRDEYTNDCQSGLLTFTEVDIVGDMGIEYLIDVENNQVTNVI